MNFTSETKSPYPPAVERLTYTAAETCTVLGIKRTTLWRLELRGLIQSVRGVRTKLYSRKAIERFVEGAKTNPSP